MSERIYKQSEKEEYKTKRIPVTYSPEEYKQIQTLAFKQGKSMSELIRDWSQEGLKASVGRDNIDLVTRIIREQLKDVLQPSMERLIALQVKSLIHSATSGYLNAEVLAQFVPLEQQQDYNDAYEAARKKAIQTVKIKEDI